MDAKKMFETRNCGIKQAIESFNQKMMLMLLFRKRIVIAFVQKRAKSSNNTLSDNSLRFFSSEKLAKSQNSPTLIRKVEATAIRLKVNSQLQYCSSALVFQNAFPPPMLMIMMVTML